MITVREARGGDVGAIRAIFVACYGIDYSDPRCYDEQQLTRLVYSPDSLILVAEHTETRRVVGTASVDLELGALADLVGEFGRLAVDPDERHRGIAKLLMAERLKRVKDRLQVAVVEARAANLHGSRLAEAYHFAVAGFLPLRWLLRERESLALFVRFFGHSLALRRNHPHVILEVYPLAHLVLQNCSIAPDLIVDENASPYCPGAVFELEELTAEGYTPLLRIERGRVRKREVFGPARLHHGMLRVQSRNSRYLIAREGGRIAGAVGFTLDPMDKSVRIFELIYLAESVIHFLLSALERLSREAFGSSHVEVDISGYSPRMQRTLIELGILPVAYLPALVFHEVKRLDIVKMIRMFISPKLSTDKLTPKTRELAELVLGQFVNRRVLPRIAQAVHEPSRFHGLSDEQVARLAGVCAVGHFSAREIILQEGAPSSEMHLVLKGKVEIYVAGTPSSAGVVETGECLGETSLFENAVHSATARALSAVQTAVLTQRKLDELIRLRPDIGLCIYKNVAVGISEKLKRSQDAPAKPAS
jgi:CRP-like cAMP-binding protein/GNAT superfamily N-acetyltransferase